MSPGPEDSRPAPPPGRGAIARHLRDQLGPPPELAEWPPVSIVVVNRDGEDHLRLLLPRLASATDYPDLELILVDNGSEDGSVELARSLSLPFPLTIVENAANLAFSDANDDGAERATHDRLLFLNNDVEPFEPGWLKELVACLETSGAAACGATLLHGGEAGDGQAGSYVLQHRRVELAGAPGFVRVTNAGDGEGFEKPGPDLPAAAVTAACLLVRRDSFERVGGFTTGFLWGWEDVDLGLKLASGGEVVIGSGRSVLFHRESSTRSATSADWQRRTRSRNRRLLAERWGPQLRREYLLDRLARRGFWTDSQPPLLVVALAARGAEDRGARELADAVEARGWRVSLVEPDGAERAEIAPEADFVLVTDPSLGASLAAGTPCIPWVRERADAWAAAPLLRQAELTLVERLSLAPGLEAAGIAPVLFSGAEEAERLIGLLRERVRHLRFCIKLSRDWDLEPAALSLRRSLELHEHACSLQLADEWELLAGTTADVVVACGDPGDYQPKPAQLNVLWTPAGLRPTQCDEWDLVLVTDQAAADSMAAETPTPVRALDLDSTAAAAEPLLELVAQAALRSGIETRVGGYARASSASAS
jgi:GT2 family glycosyltransferase